jgi:hypothetical protein
MYCKKCGGKVHVSSVYSTETYMNLACYKCGKNWDLDLHSTGPAGILGKFLQKRMNMVSNGK